MRNPFHHQKTKLSLPAATGGSSISSRLNAPETTCNWVEISQRLAHTSCGPAWQLQELMLPFRLLFSTGPSIASGNKIPGIPKSFVSPELQWSSLKMDDG
jgi:hypothetical protein